MKHAFAFDAGFGVDLRDEIPTQRKNLLGCLIRNESHADFQFRWPESQSSFRNWYSRQQGRALQRSAMPISM